MSDVRLSVRENVATIAMSSGKVNAITSEFAQDLVLTLDRVSSLIDSSEVRAVILASDREHFFSPGFHLKKIIMSGPEGILAFANVFTDVVHKLVALPAYTVAQVNGHAIAGGMILALACDERIAADRPDTKLGLNEVRIGIPLPAVARLLVQTRLGAAEAFEVCALAETYPPDEALRRGLVNAIVPGDELEARVHERVTRYASVAGKAFRLTKQNIQRALVGQLLATRNDLAETFELAMMDADLQQQILAAMR